MLLSDVLLSVVLLSVVLLSDALLPDALLSDALLSEELLSVLLLSVVLFSVVTVPEADTVAVPAGTANAVQTAIQHTIIPASNLLLFFLIFSISISILIPLFMSPGSESA